MAEKLSASSRRWGRSEQMIYFAVRQEGQRFEGVESHRLCKQAFNATTYLLTTENLVTRGQVAVENMWIHQWYENLCISQTGLSTNVSSRYSGLGKQKSAVGFIWHLFS